MFVFARKNLDPKWHFFQEKLLYIFISQSPKNQAGVNINFKKLLEEYTV
jgi:hypothetical protein